MPEAGASSARAVPSFLREVTGGERATLLHQGPAGRIQESSKCLAPQSPQDLQCWVQKGHTGHHLQGHLGHVAMGKTEQILERTLEPDSSDEEPPPVYSPPAYHMHMFDRPYPLAPPTPPPRIDVLSSGPASSQRRYRNWNPPLLGNLPDDFLRILPQQLDSIQGNTGGSKPTSGERGLPPVAGPGSRDQENRWKQYLEDERIALFLQNEEFMKELQRNRDFLLALERDRLKYESQKSKSNSSSSSNSAAVGNDFGFPSPAPGTGDANPAVSEDALFRDKLKHMGKSTRRKLFELARAFSEKTRMRKSKRKHLSKHQSLGAAVSTANLLDDVEGHTCDEDFRGRRQEAPKMEEALREGQ
uniref:CUE domain containing 1 n=1 Tax=Felis catus TaxID=9685 RepID=A0ABI7ZQA3_FELCA